MKFHCASASSPIVIAIVAILLVSAGQSRSPDDSIRLANEALGRGDTDAAESLYQEAEERTSDPGLVAFNKGTLLFRRGDFRRAELHFRRALSDEATPGHRRQRALYNLGNCLVREAGETEIKRLQSAIDCYELVLHETSDEGLKLDAAHNLEVAKLLWAKARSRKPPSERDSDWDEPRDPTKPPFDPSGKQDIGDGGKDNGPKTPDPGTKIEPRKGSENGAAPKELPKTIPGQGNLPVIPDSADGKPTDEDVRTALQRAADRLQKERQKLRQEAAQGERIRANDW